MITLTGRLICGNMVEAELVSSLVAEHVRLSRAEPGCLSFNVSPTADPLIWLVDEAFADRAAFEAHQARARAGAWHKATAHLRRDYRTTGL
ncbi:putative quinol monooxygenase [Pseudogemmobacter sonorensis]|uniref:putative quinol monooxygenase n=1 Tax=Pseudogemmobacter sonorensis TaxID=2989681 RepID=UPI003680296B